MTKCKTCDRREATPTEWDTVNEGERPDLCFGEHLGCSAHRVDWRERALRAEGQWLAWQARAAAAELTVDTLRADYALLVRAHLHSSDDYRMRVFREALARVEGWGM